MMGNKGAQSNEWCTESVALDGGCGAGDGNVWQRGGGDFKIAAARKSSFEKWPDAAVDGKTRSADGQRGGDREGRVSGGSGGRGRTGVDYRGIVAQRHQQTKRAEIFRGSGLYRGHVWRRFRGGLHLDVRGVPDQGCGSRTGSDFRCVAASGVSADGSGKAGGTRY